MAFVTSISAAQFSALAVSKDAVPASLTEANLKTCFSTNTKIVEIKNVRDLPAFGTPANIVKVPVYGSAQTQSIGAQSDAPDLEVTVNYVAGDWVKSANAFATSGVLGDAVADGVSKVFQVALLNSARGANLSTALTAGIGGTLANPIAITLIYFVGKIESQMVQPARDDAVTATVAMSIQSDFFGPFTVTATT
jgi:hypothetical protein